MGHALAPPYQGKCTRTHGHSFTAWFEYEGEIGEDGMVMDTSVFKLMQKWVDENWDHETLISSNHPLYGFFDDIKYYGFKCVNFNPTSENIAQYLHAVACRTLQLAPINLSVTVQETETIIVTYKGDK